jgi:hypothetical protein
MTIALGLLALQGAIGAFDTVYYHEWRARLPARGRRSAPELYLHAWRSLLYAVLFGTLPWVAWRGAWLGVLVAVITAEIVLTLWDFVTEVRVRRPFGDVLAGERVTHAVMGIVYGAMLAFLSPSLAEWWATPTALVVTPAPVPGWLRWTLSLMAAGVLLSGLRDLFAAMGLPGAHWPWPEER